MSSITALLHTLNDAPHLGRALETLHPCDEILIVDHGSHDATLRIAHQYGSRIIPVLADTSPGHYLQLARFDWILCIESRESLSEALAASFYEWRSGADHETAISCAVLVSEETPEGWVDSPAPQVRLVPRNWNRWQGWLPGPDPSSRLLEGHLLRFLVARPPKTC